MRYGQYGLNLYKAVNAIAKNPVAMTTDKGYVVPAIYVSELVDRYNDGTLKVEGYDTSKMISEGRIKTNRMRRDEMIDLKGYMLKSDFIRETGFSNTRVTRIAKLAGAYCQDGEGTGASVHINVNRFFHYLDTLASQQEYETFVGLKEASRLTGFSEEEVRAKVESGEFKGYKRKSDKKYRIYRTSLYKDTSMIPKPMAVVKGAKNGKKSNGSK